jgi:hypothetical protein
MLKGKLQRGKGGPFNRACQCDWSEIEETWGKRWLAFGNRWRLDLAGAFCSGQEKSRKLQKTCGFGLVPGAGLEPARLAAGDFESPESTNFTTRAVFVKRQIMAHFQSDQPKSRSI